MRRDLVLLSAILLAIATISTAQLRPLDGEAWTQWSSQKAIDLKHESRKVVVFYPKDNVGMNPLDPTGGVVPTSGYETSVGGVGVNWESAQITRQAVARLAVLSGEKTPEQAQEFASERLPDITLTVDAGGGNGNVRPEYFWGIRMTSGALADGVRRGSFLLLGRSKTRIRALNATAVPSRAGFSMCRVLFPRFVDGKPAIPADENKVTFVLEQVFPGKTIRLEFDLRKLAPTNAEL